MTTALSTLMEKHAEAAAAQADAPESRFELAALGRAVITLGMACLDHLPAVAAEQAKLREQRDAAVAYALAADFTVEMGLPKRHRMRLRRESRAAAIAAGCQLEPKQESAE